MKRLLLFLSLCFICTAAIAHTINWYVDGSVYHTTTCESGEDVTPPTAPEKYGYDFDGWKSAFFRGTFNTWENIPTSSKYYVADLNDNRTPQENDYIIVNNATTVPEIDKTIKIDVSTDSYKSYWTNYCKTYIDGIDYGCNMTAYDSLLIIKTGIVVGGNYSTTWTSSQKDILFKDKKYPIGTSCNIVINKNNNGSHVLYLINGYPYSGKWLLRYRGNWSIDNRSGWYAVQNLD